MRATVQYIYLVCIPTKTRFCATDRFIGDYLEADTGTMQLLRAVRLANMLFHTSLSLTSFMCLTTAALVLPPPVEVLTGVDQSLVSARIPSSAAGATAGAKGAYLVMQRFDDITVPLCTCYISIRIFM